MSNFILSNENGFYGEYGLYEDAEEAIKQEPQFRSWIISDTRYAPPLLYHIAQEAKDGNQQADENA